MAGRADSEGSAGTLLQQARSHGEETRMEKQNLLTDWKHLSQHLPLHFVVHFL